MRRAFLCGRDPLSGKNYEHRRGWVERRLLELARIFAVDLFGYAVMSNHVHLVLAVEPAVAQRWSDREVAARWVALYPPRDPNDVEIRCSSLRENPQRLALLRHRLADLSWFMRCLAEPIARRANAEDGCKGRFWEGRFKSQALLNERAVLAAMTYVDLNPIRAGIAKSIAASRHTSVAVRAKALQSGEMRPDERVAPIVRASRGASLSISAADYIALVDFTGRLLRPGKRGRIPANEPPALRRLRIDAARWKLEVRGIGSGYWRAVGTVDDLLGKASAMGQRWLRGLGYARQAAH